MRRLVTFILTHRPGSVRRSPLSLAFAVTVVATLTTPGLPLVRATRALVNIPEQSGGPGPAEGTFPFAVRPKGDRVRQLIRLPLVTVQFPFPAADIRISIGLARPRVLPKAATSLRRPRLLIGFTQRKFSLLNIVFIPGMVRCPTFLPM